jgi:CRISPR-associated protein Cmr1
MVLKPTEGPPSSLPTPASRATTAGVTRQTWDVALQTITPVLGGGTRTRHVDACDPIRVPAIRGHLRFWWRALHAPAFASAEALYERESALWGGVNGHDVRRSSVELRVAVARPTATLTNGDITAGADDAYALWPARREKQRNVPPAQRWAPKLSFRLTITAPADERTQMELEHAVRAWILFGGYGGRTRRGCGSLTVTADAARWLPPSLTEAALLAWLGKPALEGKAGRANTDVAVLAGAELWTLAMPYKLAEHAWHTALGWLRDFRQRHDPSAAMPSLQYAREHGSTPAGGRHRPGRSRWPEADKIRAQYPGLRWLRARRYNADPVWPRAGFGLPMISTFVDEADKRQFELVWTRPGDREPHERLASPLILKPVALRDGFAPLALWLSRAYPVAGEVVLRDKPTTSGAPFDVLEVPGDSFHHAPLAVGSAAVSGARLRTAFFTWLSANSPARRLL